MGTLNKLVLVPEVEQLQETFTDGYTQLFRKDQPLSTRWFIDRKNHSPLELCVDSDDVVFKFECFGFMLRGLDELALDRFKKATLVSDIKYIEFIYQVEWERPALPGEVPEHYEQIARRRGRLSDIPSNATDACVSLIGFICPQDNQVESGASSALYHDTGETLTEPIFTSDSEKIKRLRSLGTIVGINALEAWYAELFAWLNYG